MDRQILDIIRLGELYLDRSFFEATVRGRAIRLTRTEFDLLWALASDPGKVFQRNQLIDLVWGAGFYIDIRTVDAYIARLRKKVSRACGQYISIETIHGVGYRLKPPQGALAKSRSSPGASGE